MKEILDTRYFLQGHVVATPDDSGSVKVHFSLQAPELTLKSLDFTLPEDLNVKFQESLRRNSHVLRLGSTYDLDAESATVSALESFLTSRGYRAAISSSVDLDYHDATAKVTYRVFLLPTQSRAFMRPPSQIDCDDVIASVNLTGIDDYVPYPLIEQLMRINPNDCFSADGIAQDTERLEKTGLFAHVNYVVDGEAGSRNISVLIQGKKLQVKDITFEKYGNEVDTQLLDKNKLPLHVSGIFRQSLLMRSSDLIATDLFKAGQLAWVVPDVQITQGNQVSVRFEIVGFVAEEVYVDGAKIPGEDVDSTRATQFTQ